MALTSNTANYQLHNDGVRVSRLLCLTQFSINHTTMMMMIMIMMRVMIYCECGSPSISRMTPFSWSRAALYFTVIFGWVLRDDFLRHTTSPMNTSNITNWQHQWILQHLTTWPAVWLIKRKTASTNGVIVSKQRSSSSSSSSKDKHGFVLYSASSWTHL